LAQTRRIGGQAAIGEAERQQAAGGLLDATPGEFQEILGDAGSRSGRAVGFPAAVDLVPREPHAGVLAQPDSSEVGPSLAAVSRKPPSSTQPKHVSYAASA
ncbi:hypothetical protein, partial [Accumulibacter sp.]|uniref:hypothetical protein n=1 Tax=Accumulibacter sp. TaxID=2053492 RepID=UPI0025835A05